MLLILLQYLRDKMDNILLYAHDASKRGKIVSYSLFNQFYEFVFLQFLASRKYPTCKIFNLHKNHKFEYSVFFLSIWKLQIVVNYCTKMLIKILISVICCTYIIYIDTLLLKVKIRYQFFLCLFPF